MSSSAPVTIEEISSADDTQEHLEGKESDEDELEDVEETLVERLVGLTEMVPESVLSATTGAVKLSYWLVRRGAWVVATTAALAFLPALIEQQRLEAEEFDLARKKQMMFGGILRYWRRTPSGNNFILSASVTSYCSRVRTLFGMTNALHNLVNWRVGRILIDAPGREQHDVVLVNVCGEYVTRLLRDLVARCSVHFGCVTCTSHLADPSPSRTVQKTFRLSQHNAVNISTTSLKECRSIASHFPTSCVSVHYTSAYPTSLKWMFRETFHNAVEMGHLYTVVTREMMSLDPALFHACRALATAKVILLACHGVHRGEEGDRVVGRLSLDETSGTFLVSALSRVQSGLSFPVPNVPRQYDRAMEVSVAGRCGVLEIGPSMAAQEAMPWSLKEAFSSGQSAVALPGSSCLITNSPQFLNESHLCIHQSFIAGAAVQPVENLSSSVPSSFAAAQVSALDVVCVHDKCKWKGTCGRLDGHLNTDCPHEPISGEEGGCGELVPRGEMATHQQFVCLQSCPNFKTDRDEQDKCNVRLSRHKLDDHLKDYCKLRIIHCPCASCKITTRYNQMAAHREVCPYAPVPCPRQCAAMDLIRLSLEKHKIECPNEPVPCVHAPLGCSHVAPRSEIIGHEQDIAIHFHLCSTKVFAEQQEASLKKMNEMK
ncbi:hypothetical protein EMCRGX_G028176 [Ephydatia muelleri]